LDRALKELVESNLIDRERHRFAGSEVRTFLRPTAVALKYLGRPQDMALVVLASEKVSEAFASLPTIVEATVDRVRRRLGICRLSVAAMDALLALVCDRPAAFTTQLISRDSTRLV
jgi:hypothetical protein